MPHIIGVSSRASDTNGQPFEEHFKDSARPVQKVV